MKVTAPFPYDRAAKQVADMVEQGTPFAWVEDAIARVEASQDEKAALWLLAWSLPEPSVQVHDTPLVLDSVGWEGL
jgi:hypothetical protein